MNGSGATMIHVGCFKFTETFVGIVKGIRNSVISGVRDNIGNSSLLLLCLSLSLRY